MKPKKYDQGKVNRLANISKTLADTEGPKGQHGWTKTLSELWVEARKLAKEISQMEKKNAA